MHLKTKITKNISFGTFADFFFYMSDFFSKPYTFERVAHLAVVAIVVIALFFLVRYLSSVLLPFFIAWLLAYLFQPWVDVLTRYIKSRKVAILLVMFSILFVISAFLFYMVPTFFNEMLRLKDLLAASDLMNKSIFPPEWLAYISKFVGDGKLVDNFTPDGIFNLTAQLFPHLQALLTNSVTVVFFVVEMVFVLIYLYFILRDQDSISSGFVKLMPKKYKRFGYSLLIDLKQGMSLYYRRQAFIACIDAVMFSVGFSLIGMPMSVVMGVLLGALNMVPYLQYLGLPPAALLMVIQASESNSSIGVALLLLLAVFVAVQLVQDLYLIPKIMGKSMGMNPAVVLLSLSIWGYLLGIIGMIIALPLTTILISYYKHYVLNENMRHPFANEGSAGAPKIDSNEKD